MLSLFCPYLGERYVLVGTSQEIIALKSYCFNLEFTTLMRSKHFCFRLVSNYFTCGNYQTRRTFFRTYKLIVWKSAQTHPTCLSNWLELSLCSLFAATKGSVLVGTSQEKSKQELHKLFLNENWFKFQCKNYSEFTHIYEQKVLNTTSI